uniref:Uncharacterized protein n=1 Tax=Solanum tuberosum TaxID=4113 RepID=M1DIR9_SOLTU
MGVMGLSLIVRVHVLILFSGAAGLNLGSWVESRHVGSFGQLGRTSRTTQRFAEVPLIAFNFMLNCELGFATFDERPEFAECTRRLTESLPSSLFFAPLILKCTITFGGLILDRRKMSAIHRKAFPIADMPFF